MRSDVPDLVTVVIPTHGRADLTDRAVRSVLAQTYPAVELMIVDDASPVAYAPPAGETQRNVAVRMVRLERHSGPGTAREAGRRLASGAYLAYLDSDDSWGPRFLEVLVSALRAAPGAGMAYCTSLGMRGGDATGIIRGSDRTFDRFIPITLWHRPWHTSACVWRRSVIDVLGPWLPLWQWEDKEYDVRAGCHDVAVVHVAEPLCFVQLDAPQRLSAREPSRDADDVARALLAIAKNLTRTPWRRDATVRSQITWLLLSSLILCAEHSKRSLVWPRVKAAWQWSERKGRALALVVASPLLFLPRCPKPVLRLIRWVRGYEPVAPPT